MWTFVIVDMLCETCFRSLLFSCSCPVSPYNSSSSSSSSLMHRLCSIDVSERSSSRSMFVQQLLLPGFIHQSIHAFTHSTNLTSTSARQRWSPTPPCGWLLLPLLLLPPATSLPSCASIARLVMFWIS